MIELSLTFDEKSFNSRGLYLRRRRRRPRLPLRALRCPLWTPF